LRRRSRSAPEDFVGRYASQAGDDLGEPKRPSIARLSQVRPQDRHRPLGDGAVGRHLEPQSWREVVGIGSTDDDRDHRPVRVARAE
jgi:hypothetical protein